MSQEAEDLFSYDEEDAVKFIREYLPQDYKEMCSDDDINYIIDLIYEFYESNGLLDKEEEDTIDVDEEELLEYVMKHSKKNGFAFNEEMVRFVIQGELGYCESLGIFE